MGILQEQFSVTSDVSRDFLGIPFLAGEFRAGAQKDITVNFEQQFSVIDMYGWHGYGLFTMENVICSYQLY